MERARNEPSLTRASLAFRRTPDDWYPDPTGRNEMRYFHNGYWTTSVSNDGNVTAEDETAAWSFDIDQCTYLGSHARMPEPIERLTAKFAERGFLVFDGELKLHLKWAAIRLVRVESQGDVEARVTATRVVLLGALGFFFKKRKEVAFLTLDTGDGEWTFAIPDATPARLWAALQPVRARYPDQFRDPSTPAPAPAPPPPPVNTGEAVAERLHTLNRLLADGLIVQNEYDQRRQAILDSL